MKHKNSPCHYRVNDEIFDFLNDTYAKNSLWDTRLQESIKTFSNEEFDLISVNNTLGYIIDKYTRINTLKDIYRTLKKDGIFVTDTYNDYIEEANLPDQFLTITNGILKKK